MPSNKAVASHENDFLVFVLQSLEGLSGLESRPMFGGQGLYSGGKFFGIVWHGRVFFRTNEHTAPQYVSAGSDYFQPSATQTLKPFFEVPSAIVERPSELLRWAIQAASI
ncbi:MAG TPA: TfoX/Sxy family protein [Opitutaceae bacterium]|nr:TfoX/Sxy family protein [Opitutaceae bacterium]